METVPALLETTGKHCGNFLAKSGLQWKLKGSIVETRSFHLSFVLAHVATAGMEVSSAAELSSMSGGSVRYNPQFDDGKVHRYFTVTGLCEPSHDTPFIATSRVGECLASTADMDTTAPS